MFATEVCKISRKTAVVVYEAFSVCYTSSLCLLTVQDRVQNLQLMPSPRHATIGVPLFFSYNGDGSDYQ